MKKFFTGLLILTACLCSAFAVACNNKGKNELKFNVNFVEAEGVTYEGSFFEGGSSAGGVVSVVANTEITFSVKYEGNYDLVVKSDDYTLTPENGNYSVVVSEDTEISATLQEHVMSGTGAVNNPFRVTNRYDLIFIAEQVNRGLSAYVNGYYSLDADIDAGGATLTTIGDGTTVHTAESDFPAYFSGFFEGNGHVISNYVINSANKNYAGLFGAVLVGNNDGSGVIQNLNLDNFTVNVNSSNFDATVYAGSFIGRGIGSMLIACSATNGSIRISASNNYYSYVGGAIGQQSSNYSVSGGYASYDYASTDYVSCDVDIQSSGGTIIAGGIAGCINSADNENVTASVVNCYSAGDITNARYAGGITGRLDGYSSIANCYATGTLAARYNSSMQVDAYAGGIAGYCNTASVISDSFSKCTVTVEASGNHGHRGDIAGGVAEKVLTETKPVIHNSYAGSEADLSQAFFDKLGWQSCDWVISAGKLPVINYETVETNQFTVKYNFVGHRVSNFSYHNYNFEINNYYLPLVSYYYVEGGEGVPRINTTFFSDTAGYVSYGVFFDEALTQPVPNSYVFTKSMDLFVGFADYSEVAGEYFVQTDNRTVYVVLDTNGNYTYSDGISFSSTYVYDGESIIFEDGMFARLSGYVYTVDGVEHPEYNYGQYRFVGKKSGNDLQIYNSLNFFTEAAPLTAVKGTPSSDRDAFYGAWELSATINKKYNFDGEGGWSYSYKGATRSGSYTIVDGVAQLALEGGAAYGTAAIDGTFLTVTVNGNTELYSAEGSLCGIWYNPENQYMMYLDGFGNGNFGTALLSGDGVLYNLVYIADGGFGEALTLLNDIYLFGYMSFDGTKIDCVMYNGSDELELTFFLLDDFMGEWISEKDGEMLTLNFNGSGLYDVDTEGAVTGIVLVGDEEVAYLSFTDKNGLSCSFTCGGVEYTAEYDEVLNKIVVTANDGVLEYGRKDAWAGYVLTDGNGLVTDYNTFTFNGGGNLAMGGVLTVAAANGGYSLELGYRSVNSDITELDGNGNSAAQATLFDLATKAEIGSITVSNYKFVFTYTGDNATLRGLNGKKLDLHNDFSGSWACFDLQNFTIGTFDLSLRSTGKFRDMASAVYKYNPESNYVTLQYMSSGSEMTQSVTLYLLPSNGELFISSYSYLVQGDYIPCSRPDALTGDWTNVANTTRVLRFNGLANSRVTVGMIQDSLTGTRIPYTARFGKYYAWADDEAEKGYAINFAVSYNGQNGENVYRKGSLYIIFSEVNFNDPVITAEDEYGVEYSLYFSGNITVGARSGEYAIDEVEGNVTIIVVDYGNGETERLAVDYSDRNNPTITLLD